MTSIIKHLSGYSGSQVVLMRDELTTFVRKHGQNDRNLERLAALRSLGLSVPHVLYQGPEHYDMEYIRHTDMANWLSHNPIDGFVVWVTDVIDRFGKVSAERDYLPVYQSKLGQASLQPFLDQLPFTTEQLISKLPRYLPSGGYHGDLTMDNCLHGTDGKFYLIDPLTTDYDGWVFDLAKLMQDLVCGWFIRDKGVMLHGKLWAIRSAIVSKYPIANDLNLLILMLLRVLPYAKTAEDRGFLIKEINRLWIS